MRNGSENVWKMDIITKMTVGVMCRRKWKSMKN